MHWTPDDQQVDGCIRLHAEDGRGFTMLELFHGFVDGLAALLIESGGKLYDHKFFEGLSLHDVDGDGMPSYTVWFGS